MIDAIREWVGMLPVQVTGLLLVVLGSMLIGARLRTRGERRKRRGIAIRRQRIAQAGEDDAGALLKRKGYTVLGAQVDHTWTMWVDGEAHDVSLRADFLVERRGQRFVADAKTGAIAPDPTSRGTRRQLLEYRCAYDVDGALLIDMEQGRIIEVEFDDEMPAQPRPWALSWALPWTLGVGSAVALLWLWSRAQAVGWVGQG